MASHNALFADVQKEHSLQHVDTEDKSGPKIEGIVYFLLFAWRFLNLFM